MMSPGAGQGQFGDTTYTKVFVGGLAWETQKETMKNYFEQFGDILEAVVITDKATGRSKGYGFVTFREAEAAMRACVDAAPVIDGRRANCNLASLGAQRSKPSTPNKHGGGGGRNMRAMGGGAVQTSGGAFGSVSAAAFASYPHYAIHQGIPYNLYGYSSYAPDYTYSAPTSYYGLYGGATTQYPGMYGAAGPTGMMSGGGGGAAVAAAAAAAAFYPYLQFGEGGGGGGGYNSSGQAAGGYSVQYPHQHHLFHQYSSINSHYPPAAHHGHYASPISLAPSPALQSPGVSMAAIQASIPHR